MKPSTERTRNKPPGSHDILILEESNCSPKKFQQESRTQEVFLPFLTLRILRAAMEELSYDSPDQIQGNPAFRGPASGGPGAFFCSSLRSWRKKRRNGTAGCGREVVRLVCGGNQAVRTGLVDFFAKTIDNHRLDIVFSCRCFPSTNSCTGRLVEQV